MAKKKMGVYGFQESTPNKKVEDLYLMVDHHSIAFSVKNNKSNDFVCFEYFVNDTENIGWNQLIGYLQNKSKLIQSNYDNIYFVLNTPQFIVTKTNQKNDPEVYKNELNLVHPEKQEEELYFNNVENNQTVVYSIADSLNTLLSRSFPTGKWHHYAAFLLKGTTPNYVGVFMFENNFCIILKDNNALKLISYFKVGGDDQNTYHLLNACQNASIETVNSTIHIAGIDISQLNWSTNLKKYFQQVTIQMAPSSGIGLNLNKEYPHHTYSPYFIF